MMAKIPSKNTNNTHSTNFDTTLIFLSTQMIAEAKFCNQSVLKLVDLSTGEYDSDV